jgi:hypothetical protein
MTCTKEGPARGAAGLPGKSSFSGEGDPNNSSRPATQARDPAADRTRLQFLIRQLHRLGERPLFHFIDELERSAPLREPLEIYATLDPDFIKALGGDRFVPFFAIDGCAAE